MNAVSALKNSLEVIANSFHHRSKDAVKSIATSWNTYGIKYANSLRFSLNFVQRKVELQAGLFPFIFNLPVVHDRL